MAIFTNVLGFITTIAALAEYQSACFNDLPSKINGEDVNYSAGPAFYCMVLATLLKVVDLVIHIIVPVNPAKCWLPSDGLAGLTSGSGGNKDSRQSASEGVETSNEA